MSNPWRDLARWVRRAQPRGGALWLALGSSFGANAMTFGLFVGAPYLLLYSSSHSHIVAGGTLAILLVVIEVLAFMRAPLRYAERLASHDLGLAAVSTWRRWLIGTIGQWPFRRWSVAASGDLLERSLTDTDVLQDLWIRSLLPLGSTITITFLADLTLLALRGSSINRGAVTATLLVCQVACVGLLASQLKSLVGAERRVRAERAARSSERVTIQACSPEIHLLDRDEYVHARFDRVNESVERAERRLHRVSRRLSLVVGFGPLITFFLVAHVAHAGAHFSGRSDLFVVLFAVATADLLATARQSVGVAAAVTASSERLDALATAQTRRDKEWPGPSELRISNLRVTISEGQFLHVEQLRVGRGRRVAITGDIGAGKSSLLRVLARLDDASGDISYGETKLDDIADDALRAHVGYVSATPQLLDGIVDRVIRAGRDLDSDVDVLASLRNIGLKTSLTSRWSHLSRGEQQRAALVRALVARPDVLLLDEPTGGLGPVERELVLRALNALDATILVATHDPDVVTWCDETYALTNGRALLVSR